MKEQLEYKVFTEQGDFKILADNDMDAMRLALYYCWLDACDFIKLESTSLSNHYTLGIYLIDKHNNLHTR